MNTPTPQEILLLLQQVKPAAVAEAVRQYANETRRLQEEYADCRRLSQTSEAAFLSNANGIRKQIDEIRHTANTQIHKLQAQLDRLHMARSQDLSAVRSDYVKSRDTLRVYSEIAKTLNFLTDIEVKDLANLLGSTAEVEAAVAPVVPVVPADLTEPFDHREMF